MRIETPGCLLFQASKSLVSKFNFARIIGTPEKQFLFVFLWGTTVAQQKNKHDNKYDNNRDTIAMDSTGFVLRMLKRSSIEPEQFLLQI
jgi:hypothetical protein